MTYIRIIHQLQWFGEISPISHMSGKTKVILADNTRQSWKTIPILSSYRSDKRLFYHWKFEMPSCLYIAPKNLAQSELQHNLQLAKH